ncbi:hypothetical protein BC937DRAFT_95558 [Endogone sp. FLAS-F59071]|nr:hypothetical protein BC937DRAFT_95558 [Endogone sp. FLAS-F59071]|eukprot:RUS20278.1 hypothetical protein BC937DRAFT_95558 [Endogone sp. FLAS-F59071]
MSDDEGSASDSDSISEEELMRLEAIICGTDYIEHIVYPGEDNKSVKCYEVVPDTIEDNDYDFVHVIRTKYYHPLTQEIELVNSGPQLLQAEVIGTVCWTNLGAYGNWVPRGEKCPENIKYPTDSIFSAKLSIGLVVDDATKSRLQSIEQDIKQELPKACNSFSIDRWNRIIGPRNYLTLKAPVVTFDSNTGLKRKDRTAPLTSESDPSSWFCNYAPTYAVIDEDYQPRFFEEDVNRNQIPIDRTGIRNGDKLKVLVSFITYLSKTPKNYIVGGVRVNFDEVEVFGRKEKLKYVKPGSMPMTPKKKGRYMDRPRDVLDHT